MSGIIFPPLLRRPKELSDVKDRTNFTTLIVQIDVSLITRSNLNTHLLYCSSSTNRSIHKSIQVKFVLNSDSNQEKRTLCQLSASTGQIELDFPWSSQFWSKSREATKIDNLVALP